MKSNWDLFKNKNFLALWIAQFISALGDRFTQMSLLTISMVVSADKGEKMAMITFFMLLPFLLFGQFFGIIGDRYSRKKVMIFSDLSRAVLVCMIPFIFRKTNSFISIFIIVFLMGMFSALFSPAKMAIIPNIVRKEYLIRANSLISSCGMIATLLGTLVAGFLISAVGVYPSFFIDGITFIISAFLIYIIAVSFTSNIRGSGGDRTERIKTIWNDVKKGLSFINRHQLIFRIVQLNAVFSLLSSLFYITILNYSTTVLSLDSKGYGILLASLGIGLSIGAFLLSRVKGKVNYIALLMSGFCFVTLSNFVFLFHPNFWGSIMILFIAGFGASFIIITLDSLLQRMTPDRIRANVFGARGIVSNTMFLSGLLGVGVLVKIFSAGTLFILIGIISGITTFFIFLARGSLGYRILRGFLRLVLKLFFDLKVEGLENVKTGSKVILAGNHTSVLDGLIVMAAYPQRIYFLVAESIFKRRFLGFIARQLGFIPVKRGKLNKDAIREAIRILETRNALGIFPEGKITEDGKLTEGKKGVAVIAQKTNSVIIPFAIEGAFYAWPLKEKYPRRHPVIIKFSSPLDIKDYELPEEIVKEVMEDIREIKKELEFESIMEVDPNVLVRHLIEFR